jgi:tRNA (guanine37-N1)-methyltransferase
MKFVIVTLFPEMFEGVTRSSILGRAVEKGAVEFEFINLREFGVGPRKQVDDTPYGGGSGMVLRVDVMANAIEAAKELMGKSQFKVLLLTPQGNRLVQSKVQDMAIFQGNYILICGHYEGFDERIRGLVDEEISIGDYVMTGGEIGAMVLIDSISRLLPDVLGSEESHLDESHNVEGRIEYPHYTRPETWEGKKVPEVLLSGNHKKIDEWRKQESLKKSKLIEES